MIRPIKTIQITDYSGVGVAQFGFEVGEKSVSFRRSYGFLYTEILVNGVYPDGEYTRESYDKLMTYFEENNGQLITKFPGETK